MNKKLRTIATFARIEIKRTFRDKVAIFFLFLFPLIFLFVFGGLFGKNDSVSFDVAMINQSSSKVATQFIEMTTKANIFKVNNEITNIDQAKERMNRDQIDATIVLPKEFGEVKKGQLYPSGEAKVLYNQNGEQAGQAITAIVSDVFKNMNKDIIETATPFTVKSETTAEEGLSRFDYIFSGLLGFSIVGLGIFGPVNVFPQLKKQGVLRRLHTTTLKVWQYFTANALAQAVTGILSLATMFLVGFLVFDLKMRGDYFSLVTFLILSILTIFGIGLAVGGWAKNENQAAPLANLVTFPMLFLSGTFFPRFLMPEWLQNASGFLPLTPVVDGARLIITEGKNLLDLGPQIGLLALWAVVIYFIAFKAFRWE